MISLTVPISFKNNQPVIPLYRLIEKSGCSQRSFSVIFRGGGGGGGALPDVISLSGTVLIICKFRDPEVQALLV